MLLFHQGSASAGCWSRSKSRYPRGMDDNRAPTLYSRYSEKSSLSTSDCAEKDKFRVGAPRADKVTLAQDSSECTAILDCVRMVAACVMEPSNALSVMPIKVSKRVDAGPDPRTPELGVYRNHSRLGVASRNTRDLKICKSHASGIDATLYRSINLRIKFRVPVSIRAGAGKDRTTKRNV